MNNMLPEHHVVATLHNINALLDSIEGISTGSIAFEVRLIEASNTIDDLLTEAARELRDAIQAQSDE